MWSGLGPGPAPQPPSTIYRGIVLLDYRNTSLCTHHHLLDKTEGNHPAITAIKATHVTRLPHPLVGHHCLLPAQIPEGHLDHIGCCGCVLYVLSAVSHHRAGDAVWRGGLVSHGPGPGPPGHLLWLTATLFPYVFMGQDLRKRVRVSLRKIFENVFSEDVTTCSPVYSKGQPQRSRFTNSSEAQV